MVDPDTMREPMDVAPATGSADDELRAVALVYAATVALASVVSVRDDVPGEPFGITIPLSVPTGLLVAWGSGIAAPWPMPAAVVIAAFRARRGGGPAPARICAGIALAGIAGQLIEPIVRRPKTPAVRVALTANVAVSTILAATALSRLARRRSAGQH